MPTITVNEDGKGSYDQNGIRLIRLEEEWAFDLWRGAWNEAWAPAPFRSSWYHKCLNSNMYLRCDYIKNIGKYFSFRNEPPQIQRSDTKGAFCWHCGSTMPKKYARMFQLYFLGTQLKHPPLFSGTKTGRLPV